MKFFQNLPPGSSIKPGNEPGLARLHQGCHFHAFVEGAEAAGEDGNRAGFAQKGDLRVKK